MGSEICAELEESVDSSHWRTVISFIQIAVPNKTIIIRTCLLLILNMIVFLFRLANPVQDILRLRDWEASSDGNQLAKIRCSTYILFPFLCIN
jgi:hypothetical protein